MWHRQRTGGCRTGRANRHFHRYLCDALSVLPPPTWEARGGLLPDAGAGKIDVAWFDAQILYAAFANRQSPDRISLVNMLTELNINFDPNGWHNPANDALVRSRAKRRIQFGYC